MDRISGYAYHHFAKWSFCIRYPFRMNSPEIKENDYVFLNLDLFQTFLQYLQQYPPPHKFILISHNSDKHFSDYHYHLIKPYCNKIYAITNICRQPNVYTIPIGFNDKNNLEIVKYHHLFGIDKPILCYMNFSVTSNIPKRKACVDTFINSKWVTNEKYGMQLPQYYTQLAKSKYVLSPEGEGIDCHRIYESIYFNSIPILLTCLMDDFYFKYDFPIIVVNSWNIITEQFLMNNYEKYYRKLVDWKQKNPNWMEPTFYL
jgi:hypothetical protein